MAKERRVGVNPGEAFAEVREKGHTRHRIRGKIQEAEAKGVHDVAEEIEEGGTKPAGKIVDKEGVPIWGSLGAVGGDDARGWMPRLLSPCLHSSQRLEGFPKLKHVDRRGEEGGLRPLHRQRTLRRLRRPWPLPCPWWILAPWRLGEEGRTESGGSAMAASRNKAWRRRGRQAEVSEIGVARRVKGTVRPRLSLFMGKPRGALPIYYDVTHACGNRPTHAAHGTHTPPCRAVRAGRGKRSARRILPR